MNWSKIVVLALANSLAIFSSASAAVLEPTDNVFTVVSQQANKLGYRSYSTIVCLHADGKIALGGATGWPFGTEIYLVNQAGDITATKRISARDEEKNLRFTAGNSQISLSLAEPAGNSKYLKQEALLSVGPTEAAEKLTCFTLVSGLE